MILPRFEKEILMDELKQHKDRPNALLTIIEFVFYPVIQSLTGELDSKFDSKTGRPAYPRSMLLGVLLYCFYNKIDNLADVEMECCKNRFLRISHAIPIPNQPHLSDS